MRTSLSYIIILSLIYLNERVISYSHIPRAPAKDINALRPRTRRARPTLFAVFLRSYHL